MGIIFDTFFAGNEVLKRGEVRITCWKEEKLLEWYFFTTLASNETEAFLTVVIKQIPDCVLLNLFSISFRGISSVSLISLLAEHGRHNRKSIKMMIVLVILFFIPSCIKLFSIFKYSEKPAAVETLSVKRYFKISFFSRK